MKEFLFDLVIDVRGSKVCAYGASESLDQSYAVNRVLRKIKAHFERKHYDSDDTEVEFHYCSDAPGILNVTVSTYSSQWVDGCYCGDDDEEYEDGYMSYDSDVYNLKYKFFGSEEEYFQAEVLEEQDFSFEDSNTIFEHVQEAHTKAHELLK